ncbi:MAG: nicotinate-nucleotide adenylyltransferase [Gemmobacter sp.]
MRAGLPLARPGMSVGLLGGSFDPPHDGHLHATREALRRFGLDRVWWLVSPGNPLKPQGPAPLAVRLAAARALAAHPRIHVTDIEARIGTRYTAATLRRLMALYPGVRFVWLMGADNLAQFHLWDNWRWILRNVPVGVLARPGSEGARLAPAARAFARARLRPGAARLLPRASPPAWCMVDIPLNPASSTAIRAAGGWDAERLPGPRGIG